MNVPAVLATCRRCGLRRKARHADGFLCVSCKNPCTRCGRGRRSDNSHPDLCGPCQREPAHLLELQGGEWVREGLVWRWRQRRKAA